MEIKNLLWQGRFLSIFTAESFLFVGQNIHFNLGHSRFSFCKLLFGLFEFQVIDEVIYEEDEEDEDEADHQMHNNVLVRSVSSPIPHKGFDNQPVGLVCSKSDLVMDLETASALPLTFDHRLIATFDDDDLEDFSEEVPSFQPMNEEDNLLYNSDQVFNHNASFDLDLDSGSSSASSITKKDFSMEASELQLAELKLDSMSEESGFVELNTSKVKNIFHLDSLMPCHDNNSSDTEENKVQTTNHPIQSVDHTVHSAQISGAQQLINKDKLPNRITEFCINI